MTTYTIILTPTEEGYVARCPALPGCEATARGKQAAYRAMKAIIRRHLRERLSRGEGPPQDRTTTKFFRLDPRRLVEAEALR